MNNVISFMSANYVARQTGYAMDDWPHGDRTTNEWFAPIATFPERFGALLSDVRALGFAAIDVWAAHLHHSWATEEHLSAARQLLDEHHLRVTSYAAFVGPGEAEAICDVAAAIGTTLVGGLAPDPPTAAPVLRERGMRLGIENHAERTPSEILRAIGADGDVLGTTVDTGWWAAQGYDAARAIDEFDGHVLHVHLNDVRAVGEHEPCAWGNGAVPIEECVRALRRIGYAGVVTVEYEPADVDPTDDCRAMLAQARTLLST
jgi:sugar phosphate isomerase/epimerase